MWSLLSWSLVRKVHCPFSEVRGVGGLTPWAQHSSGEGKWAPWSGVATGCAPLSGEPTRWALQSLLVRWRLKLCSLAERWYTMDSAIGQACGLCPKFGEATIWASQSHRPLSVLHYWARSLLRLSGQVRHLAISPIWIRSETVIHGLLWQLSRLP